MTGKAVREIIDSTIENWADVHEAAIHRPLAEIAPKAASALRMLIMRDPRVQHIMEGLKTYPKEQLSFLRLAQICSERHHELSLVLFFIPERIEEVTSSEGDIVWSQVSNFHLRPTTSYQLKSILKHAGLIEDTGLGQGKKPEEDMWALR